MAAPNGNRFWMARASHGRTKIFPTPDVLWDAACEYFEWVEDNPLVEDKVNFYQGVAVHEPMAKMRAMTVAGLCNFLDISMQTWHDYCHRNDFIGVTSRIDLIIRDQKFTGAAADLLNPNIIARDLGLADSKSLDLKSSDGSMSPAKIIIAAEPEHDGSDGQDT